ncbi:MAG: hypothetical protein H7095_07145 [Pseudopedobacter sp.]|nr:hypothetical protein [Deinococcales bacterium]
MRVSTIFLVLVLILLAIFGVLNHTSLTAPHTLNLGFVVFREAPVGLYVLITAAVLSVFFVLLDLFNDLRQKAEQGRVLRQLESVRLQLETGENARFEALKGQLERITQLVSAGGRGNGTQGVGVDLSSVLSRIETVRDEIAADIAYSEDSILRQMRGQDAPDEIRSSSPQPLLRKRG